MKTTLFHIAIGAVMTAMPLSAEVDCLKVSLSVKHAVAAESSKVLEIVSNEVSSAPECSCEVVKAAIEASQAKPKTVAAIVEAAVLAAPDQMRLISQCAVAVAPDALAEVQAVLAKLDPNRGNAADSAKSSKSSKAPVGEVAAMPNPLDFPGKGPVGPTPEGPGGKPVKPIYPPIVTNPKEGTKSKF